MMLRPSGEISNRGRKLPIINGPSAIISEVTRRSAASGAEDLERTTIRAVDTAMKNNPTDNQTSGCLLRLPIGASSIPHLDWSHLNSAAISAALCHL